MPIYNGTNKIGDVYFGGNKIGKIYYGSTLVYDSAKIILLGSGKSFDVKNIYSRYANLTANNFFYLSFDSVSGSDVVVVTSYTQYVTITGNLTKSYADGVLTSAMFHNDQTANVSAVLVPDTRKLTLIGTGQTFDVKTKLPNKYSSLTANNFLVSANADTSYVFHGSRTYEGQWTATSTRTFTKTYDASTGTLNCYFNETGSTNAGESWNQNYNVTIYCYY